MFPSHDAESVDPRMVALLKHYAPSTAEERDRWHERVGEWPGASERDLARVHGDLIAADWLEWGLHNCEGRYRVTAAGRSALRRIQNQQVENAGS
jgi:hypothetical protein